MKEPDHSGPVRRAKTLAFYEMFTLPSVPKCCSPSPHLLHPFLHWKKSQQPWEFSKCMKSTKSPLPLFPLSFLLFTDSTKPNHSQVEYEIKTYSCQNFASHSTWGIWMGGCKTDRLLKFLYCWRSRWLICCQHPSCKSGRRALAHALQEPAGEPTFPPMSTRGAWGPQGTGSQTAAP